MEFSFSHKLRDIPQYIKGVDRVIEIASIINKNNHFREEGKRLIDSLLLGMIKHDASDMDFGGMGTDNRVWMRLQGRKFPFQKFGVIDLDDATAIVCSILSHKNIKHIEERQNTDFSYKLEGEIPKSTRFRGNAYMDLGYLAVNFRKINPTPLAVESLGFSPHILRKFDLDYEKKGLILVTGITGSGKSTTLDAIINMNNKKNEGHITIIGSPIEYFHKSEKCIVRHREVGKDTLSFKNGTIESLRQDPDIIVIGEMRDPDTIMTALEITDSGHKVFSTLHTGSATESIHRIVAECPTDEQLRVRLRLADVLSVVICQKLIPSLDGKRVLAKEMLNVTPNVSAAIMNDNIPEIYQMITEGKEYGMMTLEQDLMRLYITKKISKSTAVAHANNKKRLLDLLNYYQAKQA